MEEDILRVDTLQKGIVLLTIESFTTQDSALTKTLNNIRKMNPSSLIIDLRGNSGGSIGPALELSQQLIDSPINGGYFLTRKYYADTSKSLTHCPIFSEGDLDALMKKLNVEPCIEIKVDPSVESFEVPIYILIDSGTASTCEPIVHGLRSADNITIIGQRTAGKMLSAKEFDLSEGYVVFVPIADYITSKGKRLDQIGVSPEIEIEKDIDALKYTLELINN